MRIGFLDCFSGVAGDMWVGALLDQGLSLGELTPAVASLGLSGVGIRCEKVLRAGLAGTRFLVDAEGASPVRHLADIAGLLDRAALPDPVRARCHRVFQVIAEAESRAHDQPVDAVHFHEVGAEDTIVDVVCACLGTHLLGLEALYCSAVTTGTGTVRCEHGELPVPAPGTMEILRGVPVRTGPLPGERTTPTGAALLKVLVDEFEPQLTWVPGGSGYGAGSRDDAEHPNLLRLTLGEVRSPGAAVDLQEVSCNLDTATGEQLGYLLDALLVRGAIDAFATAVHMKKGRPGYQLTALVDDARAAAVVELLLEESTTLGVRVHPVRRSVLERWQETRQTDLGPVAFKKARLPSGRVVARPEDDELNRLARAHGLPRAEILRRIGVNPPG